MRSQRWIGKLGPAPHRMATKWFLKVLMALSAALRRLRCGGASWKSTFSVVRKSRRDADALLLRRWSWGQESKRD
jgi:hypothetical protein